jgi:hypothetical protein
MTVCQISRNDAEKQVLNLLKGVRPAGEIERTTEIARDGEPEPTDIEEFAKDEIVKYIELKFKGHGLARLVNASSTGTGLQNQSISARSRWGRRHPRRFWFTRL